MSAPRLPPHRCAHADVGEIKSKSHDATLIRHARAGTDEMLAWQVLANAGRRDLRRLDLSRQGVGCFDWHGVGEIVGCRTYGRDHKGRRPPDLTKKQIEDLAKQIKEGSN